MSLTTPSQPHFVFPPFEDIPVSTTTVIVVTNMVITSLADLFRDLPISNEGLGIKSLKFEGGTRGYVPKQKKGGGAFFRNSLTVSIEVDAGKCINFKLSKNGKLQMTGCKTDKHAQDCVRIMWMAMRGLQASQALTTKKTYYYLTDPDAPFLVKEPLPESLEALASPLGGTFPLVATFVPVMRNVDLSLGFPIDREKLDAFVTEHTPFRSLHEPNIGYTAVNIKIPVTRDIQELRLVQLWFDPVMDTPANYWGRIQSRAGDWFIKTTVPYAFYLAKMTPKDQKKNLADAAERRTTFLVFHTAQTIISGMNVTFARDAYKIFIEIIRNNYEQFGAAPTAQVTKKGSKSKPPKKVLTEVVQEDTEV